MLDKGVGDLKDRQTTALYDSSPLILENRVLSRDSTCFSSTDSETRSKIPDMNCYTTIEVRKFPIIYLTAISLSFILFKLIRNIVLRCETKLMSDKKYRAEE